MNTAKRFIGLFLDYLQNQKDKPSSLTIKNYKADVNQFIRWFEKKYNEEFSPDNISFFILNEYKSDRLNPKNEDKSVSVRSIERHFSSLRKFFNFLKLEGYVNYSPFEKTEAKNQKEEDPFRIKDFKDYLYVYNASRLTIKNYVIDVKQFLSWAEEVTGIKEAWDVSEKDLFQKIDNSLIEEYKKRLVSQSFSPLTVNRKLSSLRRYASWAASEGLIKDIKKEQVLNLEKLKTLRPITVKETTTEAKKTSEEKEYSNIPPVRLLQKIGKLNGMVFDAIITSPLASLNEKIAYLNWKRKGKPIFQKATDLAFKTKESVRKSPILNPKAIGNLPKEMYAPLAISTQSLAWHKKIIHHAKYTRPEWYKRYHSYSITHYFHLAILVIFMAGLGFGIYNAFFIEPKLKQPVLAALPTAPPRILSFQGRLTDDNDNPIDSLTALRFAIYDDEIATGAALLWQEIDSVDPDADGIFNIYLGQNTAIPATLFTENASLWLGVTVETTPELEPRQRIATVAYAANAETLQGLLPITDPSASQTNVVLALDSSGNLSIGGSAAPTFQATGGKFTVSGNVLALTTVAGTNSNVEISPDGTGVVDIQKPLQNTTNNNNISTAIGAIEIDDLLAILASSSGQSAFTINQTGLGPLISASSSGIAKFTVDNDGTVSSGNLLSLTPDTYNIGSSDNYWNNLYVNNIISGGVALTQYWQQNLGAMSPVNLTDALNIGATASTSAYFHVPGTNNQNAWFNLGTGNLGIGTITPVTRAEIKASTASNEIFSITTSDYIDESIGSRLLIGSGANTGDTYFYLQSQDVGSTSNNDLILQRYGGNVGIGTTSPDVSLSVYPDTDSKAKIGRALISYEWGSDTATFSHVDQAGDTKYALGQYKNGVTVLNSSSQLNFRILNSNKMVLDSSGNVGIGTTGPDSKLDILSGAGGTQLRLTSTDGSVYSDIKVDQMGYLSLSPTGEIATLSGDFNPSVDSSYSLGALDKRWDTLYVNNIIGGTTGTQGYWQRTLGSLFPTNLTDDLLLGSTATSSALFSVSGIANNQVTASVSGNLIVMPTNGWGGNIGIGTTSPSYKLDVSGTGYISDTLTLPKATGALVFTGVGQQIQGPNSSGIYLGWSGGGNGNYFDSAASTSYYFRVGGSTVFKIDASNSYLSSNLGIGTTTPLEKLDVNGNATISGNLKLAGAARAIQTTANNTLTIGGNTTGNILLQPLNGIGRVGINTTNPLSSLHLYGDFIDELSSGEYIRTTFANDYAYIQVGQSGSDTGAKLRISRAYSTSNLADLQIYSDQTYFSGDVGIGTTGPGTKFEVVGSGDVAYFGNGTSKLKIWSDNNVTAVSNVTNHPLVFGVNNSERVRIDQNGNIGIGTTGPDAKLDVLAGAGGTQLRLTSTDGSVYSDIKTDQMGYLSFAPKGLIATMGGTFNPSADSTHDLGSADMKWDTLYVNNISGVSLGGTGYWTQSAEGALFPNNSTVDLLIGGQATSSAKFAVLNMASGTPVASISAGTGTKALSLYGDGTIQTQQNNTLTIGGDTTGNILLQPLNGIGSVGIRSINTDASLTIATQGNYGGIIHKFETAVAPSYFNLKLEAAAIAAGVIVWKYDLVNNNISYPNILAFNAGNVGIGTYTPLEKLDIAGNATISGNLKLAGAARAIQTTANNTLTIGGDTTGNISLMPINGDGYVGIGTTSPSQKLEVYGGNLVVADSTFSYGGYFISDNTAGLEIAPLWGGSSIVFSDGGSENMRITGDGMVGIGTTDPEATLDINTAGAESPAPDLFTYPLRLTDTNAGGGQLTVALFHDSYSNANAGTALVYSDNDLILSPANDGKLILMGGDWDDSPSMSIINGGNVGIGTITPLSKLDIQGETAGKALVNLNYTGTDQNILTASTSGITKFYLTNTGALYGASFYDIDNTSYFLDPAATGTSLTTIGGIGIGTSSPLTATGLHINKNSLGNAAMIINQLSADSGADLLVASNSGITQFRVASDGDVYVGPNGNGKLTAATVDPLYTIDGARYSTYGTSMVGVKEEVVGKASLSYNALEQAYSYTIDLNNQEQASDLWLFSRVTDPNISLTSILLTPDSSSKVWYSKDVENRKITFYADSPTSLSFRLTAPRFDHLSWGNISDETDPNITGLIVPGAEELINEKLEDATMSGSPIYSEFSIAKTFSEFGDPIYALIDSFGNSIKKTGGFSALVASNLQAGALSASEIATESLTIGGQTIQEYIALSIENILNNNYLISENEISSPLASIDTLKTGIISPLASDSTIELALGNSEIEVRNSETKEVVARVDDLGNASFSGKLEADSLTTNEATVEGTLRAKNIIAENIEGLNISSSTISAQYITNNYYQASEAAELATMPISTDYMDISSISGQFIYVDKLQTKLATFTQGLMSFGPTSLSDTSIAGQLAVGGNLILADGAINVLGADLEIQPLRQGGISFLSGLVKIDESGNLSVSGNATFAKDVTVGGKLATGIISPIANNDLAIVNASDSAVLSVSQKGDIIASGSGTFGKLNLNFVKEALALSDNEIIATGSAGVATISASQKEITINNDLITKDSLIYITPIGSVNGLNPYLLRQAPNESFTIGIDEITIKPIPFNWLIIN